MSNPIVRLVDLCKQFGEVTAVNNINLEIGSGEFVTLLGPSGCGKTTTLRMIAGLDMPTSGSVILEEQDFTNIPPEKRPVNMVFQAYALFPHLTIAENIAFGPKIKKWSDKDITQGIQEMLRLVQLEGYEQRRPNQLSGGQSQRVALARALINRPKVLLLDEPLGALDLKLRKAMQLELRNIQQRLGMTFVYVTHDQEEAMVMSDRIVLMDEGKIIQIGTPVEIYNQPANEFASRFIGEANLLDGLITAVEAEFMKINVTDIALILPLTAGFSTGDQAIISIRPERVTLFSQRENGFNLGYENVIPGTVQSAIFLGPLVRYHVCLSNGEIFISDGTAIDGQVSYKVGEEVFVGWDKNNSVVLAAYEKGGQK
jgi:spermidine/putrescine transport system ATP-binding protein